MGYKYLVARELSCPVVGLITCLGALAGETLSSLPTLGCFGHLDESFWMEAVSAYLLPPLFWGLP